MLVEDVIDLLTIISVGDKRTVGEADVVQWQRMIGALDKDECVDAIEAHRREQPGVWLEPGHIVGRVKAKQRDRLDRMDPDVRALELADRATMREQGFSSYDRYGVLDKGAPDEPDFPVEWDSVRRLSAYWDRVDEFSRVQERELAYARPSSLLMSPPASDATRASAIQDFTRGQLGLDEGGVVEDVPHVNHLSVRCPHCGSKVGYPCTMPAKSGAGSSAPREKLTGTTAHPSRILAAAVEAGYTSNGVGSGSADLIVAAAQRAHVRRNQVGWKDRDVVSPPWPQGVSDDPLGAVGSSDPTVGGFVAQGPAEGEIGGSGGDPNEE